MSADLHFKPDYYKITGLFEPNVLEVEGTWFIKLKGVGDSEPKEELKKWLERGDIVRVIPCWRNSYARIISDVWLGNTHINRQFPNYKRDNLIQSFERWHRAWHKTKGAFSSESIKAEEYLSEAFQAAWDLTPGALKESFTSWSNYGLPQKRAGGEMPAGIDEIAAIRKEAADKMAEDFNNWKGKLT